MEIKVAHRQRTGKVIDRMEKVMERVLVVADRNGQKKITT